PYISRITISVLVSLSGIAPPLQRRDALVSACSLGLCFIKRPEIITGCIVPFCFRVHLPPRGKAGSVEYLIFHSAPPFSSAVMRASCNASQAGEPMGGTILLTSTI